MSFESRSSSARYERYKQEVRKRRQQKNVDESASALAPPSRHERTKRTRSFWTLFRHFLRLLRGFHLTIALSLVTVTISAALALVTPASTKLIVDQVLGGRPLPPGFPDWVPTDRRELLLAIVIAIVVIESVSILISMWGRWQATKTTQLVRARIRREVFDHAMNLPLYRIHHLKTGGLTSILREDTGAIADLIFNMLYNPARAIVQLVGCLAILATVDWRLLLGSLILLPTVWLTHRTWINRIRPLYRDIHMSRQETDSHVTEAFGGIRVVRGFGRQRSEAGRFARNNHFRSRQEVSVWWWSRGIDIAWSILIPAASAALLWYGGNQVLNGAITTGDLMMFLFYLGLLLAPIATLAASATGLQTSLAGLDRVLDLLHEDSEMPDRPGAKVLDPERVAGHMAVRNVSFSYPSQKEEHAKQHTDEARPAPALVLQNIDLNVQPGEMVALVGPSGAGKTTLCNLIARFYDPVEGAILLDGTDLRDITLDSYRGLLGIVEQDIFLFDGTIADNIGYARRDATPTEIKRAAELANAHEFIAKLDKGYDTIIGERGVRLSGGQRQRLAIARALLADPRILILDEATSNLDTESERLIQASLQTLMDGRTSFVIAHRLSTIAHADKIVVLENGRIVEQGTHAQLIARSGRYRQMVDLQCAPPAKPQVAAPPAAADAQMT
jgi:ATP-binding cassette subfamily B protein/subfamily B ATP-binding cassette protein MsbA